MDDEGDGAAVPTARGLFRPGATAREQPFVWAGVGALITVLSLLRQEGTPAWHSLWAEDGTLFLDQALKEGFGSFSESYNGYGHLLPRCLGMLAEVLPLAWAPWVFSVGAAVVIGLLSGFVYVACGSFVAHRGVRVLVAAVGGLSPVAHTEALNNTANLQWFLMIGLFWALLWVPERRSHRLVAGLLGLAAFGSAPLAILLLPLLVLRLIVLRRRGLDWLLLGSAGGLAYQLTITAEAPTRQGNTAPVGDLLRDWLVRGLLDIPGDQPAHVLARNLGWTAVVLVVVVIALGVVAGGIRRIGLVVALCVALSLLLFAAAYAHGSQVLAPNLATFANLDLIDGSRYGIVPIYLLSVVVLLSLDAALGSGRAVRVLLVVPAVVLVGFGVTTDYRGGAFRSTAPHWASELSVARARCARGDRDVPLRIAPPPFAVSELCTVIRAHD